LKRDYGAIGESIMVLYPSIAGGAVVSDFYRHQWWWGGYTLATLVVVGYLLVRANLSRRAVMREFERANAALNQVVDDHNQRTVEGVGLLAIICGLSGMKMHIAERGDSDEVACDVQIKRQ